AQKSGHWACAILGAPLSTVKQAIFTLRTSDRICAKKWIFSPPTVAGAPITAGISWKAVSVSTLLLATLLALPCRSPNTTIPKVVRLPVERLSFRAVSDLPEYLFLWGLVQRKYLGAATGK